MQIRHFFDGRPYETRRADQGEQSPSAGHSDRSRWPESAAVLLTIGSLLTGVTGCESSLLHNLQPHRLWRMNSTPSTQRSAFSVYSVSDDIPQLSAWQRDPDSRQRRADGSVPSQDAEPAHTDGNSPTWAVSPQP